ncbi:BgTH12-01414 [Blumeria graminis f. sp. triticale]|uniref:BgTH12-01414 n=1 Tax=Blumeria graminis f. sp. triticale TaxID=1689686 RepID=A0A9W4CYE6_BLUGR|nr:BgTH12-01414 [Blumeria graminis f. sp. triticale]
MSDHARVLELLAEKPMRPILELLAEKPMRTLLEEFQANRIKRGSLRIALRIFIWNLDTFWGYLLREKEWLSKISLPIALDFTLTDRADYSIYNHLICAIEKGYDDIFILQTFTNLAGTLSCYLFPSLPFLRIPSSPMNSSNSVLRNVPEECSHLPATPTEYFEKELGHQSFTCILKFWDRFFEGKDWSDQTKRIWEGYKNYKNDSNPNKFRFNLAEQGVWDWLASFNNLFLSQFTESPWPLSEHFPTLNRNENDIQLRGKICLLGMIKRWENYKYQGQLDFHIRRASRPGESNDWEDVRVVAGFSSKPAKDRRKVKFIEMAAYVSEIFTRQPLRRFVHGFCLFDKEIEFWLIDRTGAFSSGLISIEDDERALVRAISSYLLMSDEELGLDTTIRQVDERSMITIANGESGETREIEIDPKPLTHPRKLLSNGTTCYRSLDDKLLVKYSWRKICGKGEIDLLKEALPIKGVINLVASDTIHRFTDNWENLLSLRPKRWYLAEERQFFEYSDEESYKTSEFSDYELNRVVLSPYGRPLKSCTSVLQFLTVIRDAIMGHQRLYYEKRITHGDISQGNIIIVTPSEEDRSRGMLIDLDNSISWYDEYLSKKLRRFAGTIKYMALEVLLCNAGHISSLSADYQHYHKFDLESFFYVFLIGCVEYGRDSDQPMHNLASWDTDNIHRNVENKINDMQWKFEDLINIKFSSSFVDVKDLAIELHKIFFGISGDNFRHAAHENSMYNKMISAFNRTIGQIEAGKIPNRTWTDKKTAGA